jgi:hypothetical protein
MVAHYGQGFVAEYPWRIGHCVKLAESAIDGVSLNELTEFEAKEIYTIALA